MNNTYSFPFCHQKGKEPKGKSADCTSDDVGFAIQSATSIVKKLSIQKTSYASSNDDPNG